VPTRSVPTTARAIFAFHSARCPAMIKFFA